MRGTILQTSAYCETYGGVEVEKVFDWAEDEIVGFIICDYWTESPLIKLLCLHFFVCYLHSHILLKWYRMWPHHNSFNCLNIYFLIIEYRIKVGHFLHQFIFHKIHAWYIFISFFLLLNRNDISCSLEEYLLHTIHEQKWSSISFQCIIIKLIHKYLFTRIPFKSHPLYRTIRLILKN